MQRHQNELAAFIGPEQSCCSSEAALASRMDKLMISHVKGALLAKIISLSIYITTIIKFNKFNLFYRNVQIPSHSERSLGPCRKAVKWSARSCRS